MLVLRLAFFRHSERNWWLREGKNWVISKVRTLIWHCLSQPALIRWVRYIPASVVDHWWIPPNWWGSRKLLADRWNWSLLLMAFSMSLPVVLSRTMGQNDLGKLFLFFFGLGITTVLDNLKWDSQNSKLIQALAICTIFSKHLSFVISALRCLQEIWSGLGVDEDKHLAIASLNSCFEKRCHRIWSAYGV